MKRIVYKLFEVIVAKIFLDYLEPIVIRRSTWRQLRRAQIGINVRFHGRGKILFPERLTVGPHTRVGDNFFIMAKGGVSIGNNTQISRNVCIYSANHDYRSVSHIPYDDSYIEKEVTIGDSVWIGMNVNITPGVSIGDGAIIGMGTTVSRNVEKGAVVVGYGQKVVGYRDALSFEKLQNEGRFFGLFFSEF